MSELSDLKDIIALLLTLCVLVFFLCLFAISELTRIRQLLKEQNDFLMQENDDDATEVEPKTSFR